MNGISIFLDTNIILHLLSGDNTVANLLSGKKLFIYFISQLGLLAYKHMVKEDLLKIEDFLKEVTIIDINTEIKKTTIDLRKLYRINLPDAIISATALYLNLPLLTSDKDLVKVAELDILLYEKQGGL